MRSLLFSLVAFAWAMPAFAADTYKVPISVVPGSVTVSHPLIGDVPVAMPFSEFIVSNNCPPLGQGTLSAEVITGGLEVELDGIAIGCTFVVEAKLTLQLNSPELGGTVTAVRLEADVPKRGGYASSEA